MYSVCMYVCMCVCTLYILYNHYCHLKIACASKPLFSFLYSAMGYVYYLNSRYFTAMIGNRT